MGIADNSETLFSVRMSGDLASPDPETAVQDGKTRTSLESSNQVNFPLLQLPPELRLLIYKPLIAAGDLNIMRANKLVHKEATDLLRKNGVLRMNLGYKDRISSDDFPLTWSLMLTGTLTAHATDTIQHIEYHFNVDSNVFLVWSRQFEKYTDLIKLFAGRDTVRQSCRIIWHIGRHGWVPDRSCFVREPVLQAITNLTGFKTLVFRIINEWDHNTHHRVGRFGIMAPLTENDLPHRMLLDDYENVRKALEITLGPAILDKSLKGHFLEFHPSNFKTKADTGTGSGV